MRLFMITVFPVLLHDPHKSLTANLLTSVCVILSATSVASEQFGLQTNIPLWKGEALMNTYMSECPPVSVENIYSTVPCEIIQPP